MKPRSETVEAVVELPPGLPATVHRGVQQRARTLLQERPVEKGATYAVCAEVPLEVEVTQGPVRPTRGVASENIRITTRTTTTQAAEEDDAFFELSEFPNEKGQACTETLIDPDGHLDALEERLVTLVRHRQALEPLALGLELQGRALLVGPPGNGKTIRVQALAQRLSTNHGLDVAMARVHVARLATKYIGEAGQRVTTLMDQLRRRAEHHDLLLVFLDEFDAVASSRDDSQEHPEVRRTVSKLLTELDQLSFFRDGIFVVGATNLVGACDAAALRRMGEVITIPHPGASHRAALLRERLVSVKASGLAVNLTGEQVREAVAATEGFSCADICRGMGQAVLASLPKGRLNGESLRAGLEGAKPVHLREA